MKAAESAARVRRARLQAIEGGLFSLGRSDRLPGRIAFRSARYGFGLNSPNTTATKATEYRPNIAAATAMSALATSPTASPTARPARPKTAPPRYSRARPPSRLAIGSRLKIPQPRLTNSQRKRGSRIDRAASPNTAAATTVAAPMTKPTIGPAGTTTSICGSERRVAASTSLGTVTPPRTQNDIDDATP